MPAQLFLRPSLIPASSKAAPQSPLSLEDLAAGLPGREGVSSPKRRSPAQTANERPDFQNDIFQRCSSHEIPCPVVPVSPRVFVWSHVLI